jgi:hypothetical protein
MAFTATNSNANPNTANVNTNNAQPQNHSRHHNSAPSQSRAWSFEGGLFGAPIPRSMGSEYYLKFKEHLEKIYKAAFPGVIIDVLDLDNNTESALAFSSVIVALSLKDKPAHGVAYHILILEATGDQLTPITDSINNSPVEILRVTGDAYDQILVNAAGSKVAQKYPGTPLYLVDACVVPREFNPSDETMMQNLALNAGLATLTELEVREDNFNDINLQPIAKDSTLNITVGFNKHQLLDVVGMPMRTDALINFTSKKQNQTNQKQASVNQGSNELKISEISCFTDLVWSPVAPAVFNPYAQIQQTSTQKYIARLVITNLASNHAYTTGSTLLAIATSMSLRDDSNWYQAFRPSMFNEKELDLSDIGSLNYEANLENDVTGIGRYIDTKTDSFTLEDLGQLVAALVQPGLVISLDCPEVAPQTWYTRVFAAASFGDMNAYNEIYEAASTLTNRNFEQYFPHQTAMFEDRNNRVHNGYWIDNKGNKRDIRDFDHLAVCNLIGERNTQSIRDWSDTFLRQQYPLEMRLSARKRMISSLANEKAVFTGFSQRVTFSAKFLDALARGIKDTGLNVKINTPLTGSDFSNQRGVATFANNALLTPGQSFMSVGGFQYNQNHYQPQYQNFGNRWE